MADVRKGMESLGLQVNYGNPTELAASMRADLEKYSKVIRDAKITAN
jgi:tripartite-type tricarboxylate transporter receptor subunit TctC